MPKEVVQSKQAPSASKAPQDNSDLPEGYNKRVCSAGKLPVEEPSSKKQNPEGELPVEEPICPPEALVDFSYSGDKRYIWHDRRACGELLLVVTGVPAPDIEKWVLLMPVSTIPLRCISR